MLSLVCLLLLSVTSCANGQSDSACLLFQPLRPTQKDVEIISDKLVQQIITHNKTGERLCRWKP